MTSLCLYRIVRIDCLQFLQSFCATIWVNLLVYTSIADITLRILWIHNHTLLVPASSLTTVVLHGEDITFQDICITIILEFSDNSICYCIAFSILLVDDKGITQCNKSLRIFLEGLLIVLYFLSKFFSINVACFQCSLNWLKCILIVHILSHCRSCQTHDEQTCY